MSLLTETFAYSALEVIQEINFNPEDWATEVETLLRMDGCKNEVVFTALWKLVSKLETGLPLSKEDAVDMSILICMTIPLYHFTDDT